MKIRIAAMAVCLMLMLSACASNGGEPDAGPGGEDAPAAQQPEEMGGAPEEAEPQALCPFSEIDGIWELRASESTTDQGRHMLGGMRYFEFTKSGGSAAFRSTYCQYIHKMISVDFESGPATVGYGRYVPLQGGAEMTDESIRMEDGETLVTIDRMGVDEEGYQVQITIVVTQEDFDPVITEFEAVFLEVADPERQELAAFQLEHASIDPVIPDPENVWKGDTIIGYPAEHRNMVYTKIAENLPVIADYCPVIIEKGFDITSGTVVHATYDYNVYPADEDAVALYFGYDGDGVVTEDASDMIFLICYLKESVNFCAEYSYYSNQHVVSATYQGRSGWYVVGDKEKAADSRISVFGQLEKPASDTALGRAIQEYQEKNDTGLSQHFIPVYPFVDGMHRYDQTRVLEYGDHGQVQKVYSIRSGKLLFENDQTAG